MPPEENKNSSLAKDVAVAGLSRGVAGATETLSDEGVSRLAERAVRKYKKKRGVEVTPPEEKLVGAGFLIIVLIAFSKDMLDIVLGVSIFLSFLIILTT